MASKIARFNDTELLFLRPLKIQGLATSPQFIQKLRDRNTSECPFIASVMLRNVRQAFENCLYLCMQASDEHFEQSIR